MTKNTSNNSIFYHSTHLLYTFRIMIMQKFFNSTGHKPFTAAIYQFIRWNRYVTQGETIWNSYLETNDYDESVLDKRENWELFKWILFAAIGNLVKDSKNNFGLRETGHSEIYKLNSIMQTFYQIMLPASHLEPKLA